MICWPVGYPSIRFNPYLSHPPFVRFNLQLKMAWCCTGILPPIRPRSSITPLRVFPYQQNWRAREDSNPHTHLLSSVLETDVLPIKLLAHYCGAARGT
jgi:hypothetical protein